MRRIRKIGMVFGRIGLRNVVSRKREVCEFVTRAQEFAKPMCEQNDIERRSKLKKWQIENKDKYKKSQKKYALSEKGKEASVRRNNNRKYYEIQSQKGISLEELELVKLFYRDCPEGLEVDHIIPVSKGGKHCLNNLRYITRDENREKASKIIKFKKKHIYKWQILEMAREKGIRTTLSL
jgi:CRISPR/Cas system Type II protein with McrA/HNH and RuvC-like nuclease domain